MISLTQRTKNGYTVAEYLELLPDEADGDGDGLWSVVKGGQSFDFEGADLAEFVRLCVLRYLDAGCAPVRFAEVGPMQWLEQKQFGTDKNEIADAVVAEWLAAGGGNPPWEWLWFVTRQVLETEPFVRYR